jgi:hypothetical protein
MIEMGCLDQEELTVVCPTTKNEVQGIVTSYEAEWNIRGEPSGAAARL